MKRILCLVMVLMFVMSPAVFAGNADEVAALYLATAKVSSAEGKITFSTKLNEPLDLLGTIPVESDVDIDYQLLIEEIIGATAEMEYAYSVSDDKKKMDMSLSMVFDTPVALNEEFRIEAWTKIGAWLQWDVTDLSNPVYQMILKVPFEKDYLIMDFSEMIQDNPAFSLLEGETAEMLQEEMTDALLRHAKVQKKNFEYTISFDDPGARAYLAECIEIYREFMKASNVSNTESYYEADKIFQDIIYALEHTALLGEKGLEIKVLKNSMGLIRTEVEKLHLNFNVYDLLVANGQSTEGLSREQGTVNLTLEASMSYDNHNHTKVTFPQLTEENSKTILDDYNAWNTGFVAKKPPVFQGNHTYFPIESMAEQIGETISIEQTNEGFVITYPDGTVVSTHGNSVFFDDGELPLDAPAVIVENDEIYCLEDLLYPLNIMSTYVSYHLNRNEFYITFEVVRDVMEEYVPDEEYEEEDSYVPMMLYYDFFLERSLYQEDNMIFVPVYEFVSVLFAGEFGFGNHRITYTALGENPFDIQTISASDGDAFVMVNGEQIPLTHCVKEVNGVINIPISFAKELGLSGRAQISQNLMSEGVMSHCSFSMDNPDYQEEYDDISMFEQLYFWVSSDQVPCVENGEVYIPLYDLLETMFDGEFTFAENGLEYIANGDNPVQIQKVSATVGDHFVTVDGEKVSFENEVITVNDIIRVPISFTKELGIQLDGISSYMGTSYRLSMDNPSYQPSEQEAYKNKHWFYSLFQ